MEDQLKVLQDTYQSIERVIHSDQSPVGIDAKKTHIIILDKLLKIEAQLRTLEERISQLESPQP